MVLNQTGPCSHCTLTISLQTLSKIRLFADDCVCYREIKEIEDTVKLQKDIDRLGRWAREWGMRFQPVKCNMMQLTKKLIHKIQALTPLRVQYWNMLKVSNTSV